MKLYTFQMCNVTEIQKLQQLSWNFKFKHPRVQNLFNNIGNTLFLPYVVKNIVCMSIT